MKKIDTAREMIKKNIQIIRCPKCKGRLFFDEKYTLTCENRHCYDISAKGYINFILNNKNPSYSKGLFRDRRDVFQAGFFHGISKKILSLINDNRQTGDQLVLDAGCGEGSLLNFLTLDSMDLFGIGVDISKEGIGLATDAMNTANMWVTSDIASLPLDDHSFDFVLNMLSPAHYTEFERVLKKDGLLIKVSPGRHYLKELRDFFYRDTAKEEYADDRVAEYFQQKCWLSGEQDITYLFPVKWDILNKIVHMTPLAWNVSEEIISTFLNIGISHVTADFKIMWGRIK